VFYILLFLLFGVAISDLNVVIFASQPAGLTEGLLVGSGHENLDRFHRWSWGPDPQRRPVAIVVIVQIQ